MVIRMDKVKIVENARLEKARKIGTCDSAESSTDCFSKDGRKINVGDCALFKPPQDSPPFIGVIRCLTFTKENNLQLGVNWLYRPGEVKLGKGFLLDAAPNEVFYSFHKDEIPAASLLHPCKVAFLPKGVDLPSGISSFVCRRVYDVAYNRLWWLTDKDYIDEQQEEVNQLLHKTQIEMHAKMQPSSRSPKPLTIPISVLQVKPGSDMQASPATPSNVKGKKREPSDRRSEPMKRERTSKTEDLDPCQFSPEGFLKLEISKITEKGGLIDLKGVGRLVELMQLDRAEKKVDLTGRSRLASVVAATDKFDCLSEFVHLKGLSVLDEWLQDIHKGKIGDGSPKDSDKSVEDLLLILLRALDKLPVNLQALKKFHVGKSVNNLRTHKNMEIQKKARGLVDTWKKRVEAEMNAIDSKSTSPKTVAKSLSSAGPTKTPLLPATGNALSRLAVGSSPTPSATLREERNSTSSQSHNNDQSCSNDNGKAILPVGKEDGSSTAASTNANRIAGASRHRKFINCLPGPAGSHKNSLPKTVAAEKDVSSVVESNHKLTVKIPNRGCSPAHSVNEGSIDDPSTMNSRASSPILHDLSDRNLKEKPSLVGASASDANAESWQSNDFKEVLVGSEEGDASPAGIPEAGNRNTCDDVVKRLEISKAACSEGVKNSEATASVSVGDEVGMNLLASVAAGEVLAKSDLISSSFSPQRCAPTVVYSSLEKLDIMNPLNENLLSKVSSHAIHDAIVDSEKQVTASTNSSWPKDESDHLAKHATIESSGGTVSSKSEQTYGVACIGDLQQGGEPCNEVDEKSGDVMGSLSLPASSVNPETTLNGVESKNAVKVPRVVSNHDGRPNGSSSLFADAMANIPSTNGVLNENVEGPSSGMSLENGNKDSGNEGLYLSTHSDKKLRLGTTCLEGIGQSDDTDLHLNDIDNADGGRPHDTEGKNDISVSGKGSIDQCDNIAAVSEKQSATELKMSGRETMIKNDSVCQHSSEVIHQIEPVGVPAQESEPITRSDGPNDNAGRIDGGAYPIGGFSFSATKVLHSNTKMKFDLNEGVIGDDAKSIEVTNLSDREGPPHSVTSLTFSVSPVNRSLPASITVASAAKGPFVYSDDLLKSKGEPGWRGSAATSAFRPAEPRKVPETPFGSINDPLPDRTADKHSRPVLDIDLNVADERILEELSTQSSVEELVSISNKNLNSDFANIELISTVSALSSSRLDLDLNEVDESGVVGKCPGSSIRRTKVSPPAKSSSSVGFLNFNVKRDFDLNDGPIADEPNDGALFFSHHRRSNIISQQPTSEFRVANMDVRNSSWFSPGNAFSCASTNYMDPSSGNKIFPIANSQLFSYPSAVSSQYHRPFVGLPDGSNSAVVDNMKWIRQGLDLNSGLDSLAIEAKDDASSLTSRQRFVASPHALAVEQERMYQQMTTNALKRKDPEGGWDNESFRYKQASWQ
ncbi:uncharacterized protein LOC124944624 [Impatiens glandulifera]|uniref:uncharacterized protein LOC124944624 n=1 Tax=Impatiens glandulifera TaxID=253017 RepID=UPI001FB0977A|nr:uncharacterized protein LOC124944624 [Impatiens glandulifera]